MIRLLHTADWQIGRVYSQFEADDAAALFEARFQVVERLAALAHEHSVDAVLVAGDVFDAQTVSDKSIRRLCNAMQDYAGPWLLLPGNHDAALAESVWTRARRLDALPGQAVMLTQAQVHIVADRFALLPAPLTQRHTHADLTEWFAGASTPDGLPRIGLAHGCVQGVLPEAADSANPIAAGRADSAGLDYLALGDWHGSKAIDGRCWYAGTPETDRFRANDSGQALLVEIDGPGSIPRVQPVSTGQYRWRSIERTLTTPGDTEQMQHELESLSASDVLLLRLAGHCELDAHQRLLETIEKTRGRVRAVQAELDALQLQPTAAEIDALKADGYVGAVLDTLRHQQQHQADGAVARDALLILAQWLRRNARQGGS